MLIGVLIGALVGGTVGVIVMALVNAGARADECAECKERQRRAAWTLELGGRKIAMIPILEAPPFGEEEDNA